MIQKHRKSKILKGIFSSFFFLRNITKFLPGSCYNFSRSPSTMKVNSETASRCYVRAQILPVICWTFAISHLPSLSTRSALLSFCFALRADELSIHMILFKPILISRALYSSANAWMTSILAYILLKLLLHQHLFFFSIFFFPSLTEVLSWCSLIQKQLRVSNARISASSRD